MPGIAVESPQPAVAVGRANPPDEDRPLPFAHDGRYPSASFREPGARLSRRPAFPAHAPAPPHAPDPPHRPSARSASPAASAAGPLPALPVTALPRPVRFARYPGLVTADKAAQPVDRLHPIKIVRALRAQDAQQAQRQHHLLVGAALLPHNTRRQIPKPSALRRRMAPQRNAATRRRVGPGVRKMVPDRESGVRDHSPFVQDRICHISYYHLLVRDKRGTPLLVCRG